MPVYAGLQGTFEEHHYLKQGLPLMWGLLVRDEQQFLVEILWSKPLAADFL